MIPQYKSPLEGYKNATPLPETFNNDGKSLYNPPGPLSAAYEEFPILLKQESGIHFHSKPLRIYCCIARISKTNYNPPPVYYMQGIATQAKYAKELHERVRREFPEVVSYALPFNRKP